MKVSYQNVYSWFYTKNFLKQILKKVQAWRKLGKTEYVTMSVLLLLIFKNSPFKIIHSVTFKTSI